MFYESRVVQAETSPGAKSAAAMVVLNPSESKRLIAKAIAQLPEVKAALSRGLVVIGMGTTNAFVVEELLGITIDHKSDFASGIVSEGELRSNHPDNKIIPYVLKDGKRCDWSQWEALVSFEPGDVFIKGANAVDPRGDVGILAAGKHGGSVSDAWFPVTAGGGHLICPVGLEKLVPSVEEASRNCGNMFRFKYAMGTSASLVRFTNARVVTEVQAISVLTGARCSLIAAGGIGGSEGAVVLTLDAEESVLEKAFELVKSVKGEPPVPPCRKYLSPPAASVNYDPAPIRKITEFVSKDTRIYGGGPPK